MVAQMSVQARQWPDRPPLNFGGSTFDENGIQVQNHFADTEVKPKHRQMPFRMSVRDLIKATVVCGLSAFFVYSYPVVGQVVIIGGLSLLWLSYAFNVVRTLRR